MAVLARIHTLSPISIELAWDRGVSLRMVASLLQNFFSLDGCTYGPSRESRYFSRPAARFPLPPPLPASREFCPPVPPPPPLPALFMVVALIT